MGFQDLLDDLACWNVCQTEVTPAGYEVKDSPALAVARRVAALYKKCPDCGGAGYWVDLAPEGKIGGRCLRCAGTGLEASEVGQETQTTAGLKHLADYLFGEDRRGG